jgi:hypothetical protein
MRVAAHYPVQIHGRVEGLEDGQHMGGARQDDRPDVLMKTIREPLQPLQHADLVRSSRISKVVRLRGLRHRHQLVDQWPNSVLKRISSGTLGLNAHLKICKLGKDFVLICCFHVSSTYNQEIKDPW